jgi:hypothetical protein
VPAVDNPTLCSVSDDRAPYIAARHSIEVMGEVWTGRDSDRHFYQLETEWEESDGSAPGELVQLLAIRGARSGPEFAFEGTAANGAWFRIRGPAVIYALARVLEELAKRVEEDLWNRAAGEKTHSIDVQRGSAPRLPCAARNCSRRDDSPGGRIRRRPSEAGKG